MAVRIILVLFLFLMWSFGSGWYYLNEVKQVNSGEVIDEGPQIPFGFEKSSALLILGKGYLEKAEELRAELDSTRKLVIIGQYSEDELNNSLFEDLGKARAYEVQQHLDLSNPMVLRSEMVSIDWSTNLVNGVRFEFAETGRNIIELDGGVAVLLPRNAVPEELPADVEDYLNGILQDNSDALIDLVGHSRDRGNAAFNITMGYNAAFLIRDWLVANGHPEDLIGVVSEGAANQQFADRFSEGVAENIVEIYIR